jgi:hypothetical protein
MKTILIEMEFIRSWKMSKKGSKVSIIKSKKFILDLKITYSNIMKDLIEDIVRASEIRRCVVMKEYKELGEKYD